MRLSALVIAATATFALAGCSDDGEQTRPSSAPSSDAQQTDDPATEPKTAAGPECLTGSWLADNEFFLARLKEFADEMKDVRGDVVVTFRADGSIQTTYDKWHIEAVVHGMPSTIERSGDDRGTFTATDTSITIREDRVTSKLKMTAAGRGMAIPANPVNYTDASYTCSASSLVITTPDGPMKMTRR